MLQRKQPNASNDCHRFEHEFCVVVPYQIFSTTPFGMSYVEKRYIPIYRKNTTLIALIDYQCKQQPNERIVNRQLLQQQKL